MGMSVYRAETASAIVATPPEKIDGKPAYEANVLHVRLVLPVKRASTFSLKCSLLLELAPLFTALPRRRVAPFFEIKENTVS